MDYGSGASTLNGIFEWRDTVVKASYSIVRTGRTNQNFKY